MKILSFLILSVILTACHDPDVTHHRTYVISKSNASAAQSETVTEVGTD